MLLQKFLKKKYKKNWKVEVGKDGLRYIHIRMIGTTKFKQQDFEESDKWVTGEFLVPKSLVKYFVSVPARIRQIELGFNYILN